MKDTFFWFCWKIFSPFFTAKFSALILALTIVLLDNFYPCLWHVTASNKFPINANTKQNIDSFRIFLQYPLPRHTPASLWWVQVHWEQAPESGRCSGRLHTCQIHLDWGSFTNKFENLRVFGYKVNKLSLIWPKVFLLFVEF